MARIGDVYVSELQQKVLSALASVGQGLGPGKRWPQRPGQRFVYSPHACNSVGLLDSMQGPANICSSSAQTQMCLYAWLSWLTVS
jgi:hypothetical protein